MIKKFKASKHLTTNIERHLVSRFSRQNLSSSTLSIEASEKQLKDFKSIPGPKSYPFLYNLFSLKKYGGHLESSYPLLVFQLQKEYGKLVKFSISQKPEIYVYDPESIEKVFMLNEKEPSKKKFEPWIMYFDHKKKAQSLNNSDGPRWRKLRSAINPVLSRPQSVVKHIDSQNKIVDEAIDYFKWKIDQTPTKDSIIMDNFQNKMKFLALELVSHAAFGKKIAAVDDRLSTKETQEFIHVLHEFVLRMSDLMSSFPIWKYVSTKKWKDFETTTDKFLNFIGDYIQEAFRNIDSDEQKNSVVKHLIENKEKYNITEEDIQSTVSELFTGGIETTSTSLHFALIKLGTDKKIQDELYAEIKRHVKPGQPIDETVLANVKYLKAFLKELLRYYPILLSMGRVAVDDMVLHGYKIPKGTFLNVVSGVTSRLESVFDNASKFDPKRWLDPTKKYHRFSMAPFGFGARNCVARRLSEQTMYIIIIKMIENFEIEYTGEEFGYTDAVFSGPDKPLSLRLTKRANK